MGFVSCMFLPYAEEIQCHPALQVLDEKILCRKDFKRGINRYLMLVHSTKTLQDKSRKIEQPLVQNNRNILCPVAALDYMFRIVPAHSYALAFCTPLGNPINYWTFKSFIKDVIDRTGLAGDKYSTTHSIGGDAHLLLDVDCRIGNLKMRDWKSNFLTDYSHSDLQDKLDVAVGMTQGILNLNQ